MPRAQRRWNTRFGAWVSTVTVPGILNGLRREGCPVSRLAVYHWVAGRGMPRLPQAAALITLSDGAISVADIVAHQRTVREGGTE